MRRLWEGLHTCEDQAAESEDVRSVRVRRRSKAPIDAEPIMIPQQAFAALSILWPRVTRWAVAA